MTTPGFLQVLVAARLLPYQFRLAENGFDDIESLCEMSEDDMRTIGIPPDHRKILQWIFGGVRCQKLAAFNPNVCN